MRSMLYGSWQRLEPAFVGFWLGIASRNTLYSIDEAHYRRSRRYYTAEHNLGGLFDWEEPLIRRWFADRCSIAVLGAGAGREVIALGRLGHKAHGFECNAALVELGNELLARESGEGRLELLEREQAPGGRYDAVIAGWSSYMLIPGRDLRIAMLRQLHSLIPDGAPLLLSFFTREGRETRFRLITRVGNPIRRLLRRPPIQPGDDLVPNYVHWFTRAEIEEELGEGGFRMVEFEPQRSGATASGYAVGIRNSN